MAIISNTSPILNLAIVDSLHLLRQQFHQVLIPAIVRSELLPSSGHPGVRQIERAFDDKLLLVRDLHEVRSAQALMLELDAGEAEAIALALELGHTRILIDERDGRAKAKALGLQPIGVLGVLLRAKRNGQIASVTPIITALRQDAGFFVSDTLIDTLLRESGER